MIQNPFFQEIHGNFGFGCMRLPMKDGKVNYDEFCRISGLAKEMDQCKSLWGDTVESTL